MIPDRESPITRDHLFLLSPDFEDPAYPGRRFYCWHCALLEGVLASYPALAERVTVKRIAWSRPRLELVSLVGEGNQSLPLLVLADDAPAELVTGTHGIIRFVAGRDQILRALTLRHGTAEPHP